MPVPTRRHWQQILITLALSAVGLAGIHAAADVCTGTRPETPPPPCQNPYTPCTGLAISLCNTQETCSGMLGDAPKYVSRACEPGLSDEACRNCPEDTVCNEKYPCLRLEIVFEVFVCTQTEHWCSQSFVRGKCPDEDCEVGL
jgi:hypothetical protein